MDQYKNMFLQIGSTQNTSSGYMTKLVKKDT